VHIIGTAQRKCQERRVRVRVRVRARAGAGARVEVRGSGWGKGEVSARVEGEMVGVSVRARLRTLKDAAVTPSDGLTVKKTSWIVPKISSTCSRGGEAAAGAP